MRAQGNPRLCRPLGAVIKTLRKTRGLSHAQMAALIGCSAAAVRAWEGGRHYPTLHHLVPLCDALELPVSKLLALAERREAWERLSATDRSRHQAARAEQLAGGEPHAAG